MIYCKRRNVKLVGQKSGKITLRIKFFETIQQSIDIMRDFLCQFSVIYRRVARALQTKHLKWSNLLQ